ncbi:homoserine dehydrogenase [Clostridium sp. CAG:632]|nr:homoserine dehydrogenase [Clostridium sp.]CCY59244.1 homoserine dehydrogenase [Clostridium sp. CAG:632]
MVNIAVLGYGTVGSGVVEVIQTNQEIVNKRAGQEVNIKYVLDLREFEGDPIQKILVHDYDTILNDKDVKVVVEVMGGVEPAHTFVKQALENGKSVCTSNKEMVAKYGAELIQIAEDNNVNFLYEASVGGGIPIIRPLTSSLTCDDITEVSGILNGTTNYILTKMRDEGAAFADVLREAQEKGYAERNPEADIEGYDACRKIAILTSLVCGQQVDYEDVHTEGITKITEKDFLYAKALKGSIKLLGTYQRMDGKAYVMVAPMIVSEKHPLYHVDGVFNAIFVHGNMLDDAMFYGRGAGKLPTASAVVSDVVDEVKHMGKNIMQIWEPGKLELGNFDEWKHKFLVRIQSADIDDVDMEDVKEAFGDVLYIKAPGVENETAFVTTPIEEGKFREAIQKFSGVLNTVRVGF